MKTPLSNYRFTRIAVLVLVGAVCAPATASTITFSSSAGSRAASATFQTSGSDLIVTLQNTSTADVLAPGDVLTALFFNVNGAPLALTPISAIVPDGSLVLFGGTDPGGAVGGEWAYRSGLAGPRGATYGISSSGLGLFGPGDLFPGSNLQGPVDPDGLQYGITSAGDDPTTGNHAVTGANALIQYSVVFTLAGLPAGFDPSQAIDDVNWQYGTSLSETNLPEPATLSLLGLAGAALLRRRQ